MTCYQIENWDHYEHTGNDYGLDMTFDYIEGKIVTGRKIEVQIKGRSNPNILKTGIISFPLYTITINYALTSGNPFLLMLYVVKCNEVYYLDIKDYFSDNKFIEIGCAGFYKSLYSSREYLCNR